VRACLESAIGATAVEHCNLRLFGNCRIPASEFRNFAEVEVANFHWWDYHFE
jgi:hypothetical protein